MRWAHKFGRFLTITWVRIWGLFSCIWLRDNFVLCLTAIGLFSFVCYKTNINSEEDGEALVMRIVLGVLSWLVAWLILVYLLTGKFDVDIPLWFLPSMDKIAGNA